MESDVTQSAVFFKTWAWVDAHKKQVLTGAVALVVVGLGIGVFVWQQNEKQVTASEALSRVATQSMATGQAASPDAFVKIASEHPGTDGAARALLVAGARFFSEGKYADAQAQFQKFLAQYGDSEFSGQAALGVAASLDAQGKSDEAIKAYKEIAERRSNDTVMPQAKLSLARLYVAKGNLTQARDAYEQLARPDFGAIGQEAAMHLNELLSKNPSLLQPRSPTTNAPVMLK